jgi:probable rRNA maturation factor
VSLEIEVIGGPAPPDTERLCTLALASAGVDDGHLALEWVAPERIQELNREFRDRDTPTDVLSFPVDEAGEAAGPRELGDVVICPEHTRDVREAIVHGVLHLVGMDHETDDGEMLALQAEIMAWTAVPEPAA